MSLNQDLKVHLEHRNSRVNYHPHSGWLDFALKGHKAKTRSV